MQTALQTTQNGLCRSTQLPRVCRSIGASQPCGAGRSRYSRSAAARLLRNRAVSDGAPPAALDISKIAELIATQPLQGEQQTALENIAKIMDVPMGTAKQMTFKKRALLTMDPEELQAKLQKIATVVDVPLEKAKQMVAIQPGLLFDTDKQAEALQYGIRAISYELNAPKEEVVDLILQNQSVLHGREMHLSVADIAHLAMLREPTGRIVD